MDPSVITRLRDTLSQHDQIGILVGRDANLDKMAAGLSLYLALQAQNKRVTIASPTEPIVEISSLVGIDKVQTELGGEGGDLIVSFPYHDGEIDKVSYTLEDDYLNIVVKAGEKGLSFSEKEVLFKRKGGSPSLLFIVGVSRLTDLGRIFDPEALKNTTVVNIDTTPDNQGYGDIVVVSPSYSSLSEHMATLIEQLGIDIDVDIAQNLLLGIESATDNFQNPKTSLYAFEVAAQLMRRGATRARSGTREYPPPPLGAFPPFDKGRLPVQPFPRPAQEQRPMQQQLRRPQQQFPREDLTKTQLPRQKQDDQKQQPPSDWLTPKVYKGSSLV